MAKTSTGKSTPLADRLAQQAESEREALLSQVQNELKTTRSELKSILRRELNTMQGDIQAGAWAAMRHRLLWPSVVGLSFCLSLAAGLWGLTAWQSSQIMSNSKLITQQRETLKKLESQGGRIQFSKCGDSRRLCAQVYPQQGTFGTDSETYMILRGY